jgi:hypothetical protein
LRSARRESSFLLSFFLSSVLSIFLAGITVNKTYFDFFLLFRQLCSHIINYCVVHLKFPVTTQPLPFIR